MALIQVIKYDGTPDVFAWKYPNSELGTWTQLIVNQSQEAVLFKDGRALDLFGPGRHTLTTPNIPILNKIINLPFGGDSPFAAEVWFVNKAHVLDVKWGTSVPVKLQDPKYNIIVPVRSFGQLGVRIEDSRKFLVKLVGTLPEFNRDRLRDYFRGMFMMNFSAILSSFFVHRKISVLEINAYLGEMADYFKEKVASTLEEFGIRIVHLFVHSVNLPENDPSIKRLRDALARKAEMDIIGYNYQQERTFDTLEGAAKNEGAGGSALLGAGLGLGMGVGVGGAFAGQFSEMSKILDINSPSSRTQTCPNCRRTNKDDAKFCSGCGTPLTASSGAAADPTAVATCNNCGQPLPKGSKFCPSCGDKYHPCPNCGADNAESNWECVQCKQPLPRPCPHCSESVMGGSKFCPHCGGALSLKCPNCQQETRPGQKFCAECGFHLEKGGGNG